MGGPVWRQREQRGERCRGSGHRWAPLLCVGLERRACLRPGSQSWGSDLRDPHLHPGLSWRTSGLFSQGGTAPEETGALDAGREAPRVSPIIPRWSGCWVDSQPETRRFGCRLKAVRNGNAFAVTKMGP